MKHFKSFCVNKKIYYLFSAMVFVFASLFGVLNFKADGDDTPKHFKRLASNGDGTYKLALDVTGASVKEPKNNVNVVIIFDTSGSMKETTGNVVDSYTATTTNGDDLYGLVDGEYVELERQGYGWGTTYWYDNNGTRTQYTGTRYNKSPADETRLIAAQNAIKSISKSLLKNNTSDDDETVEIALVTFSTKVNTVVDPTNKYDDIMNAVNAQQADGGTNWEDALTKARSVDFDDDDQTYVIFVSDGNPTFRNSAMDAENYNGVYERSNTGGLGYYNNNYVQLYYYDPSDGYYHPADGYSGSGQLYRVNNQGQVREYNGNRYSTKYDKDSANGVYGTGHSDPENWNYDAAKAVARDIVDDDKSILYSIGAYGEASTMEALSKYAYNDDTEGTEHYYDASDTSKLQDALNEILEEIQVSGISSVSISDGTTTSVKASSGTVHLLSVDESSYQYWLSMEVSIEDSTGNYVNEATGNKITFTKNSDNTYTGTWTDDKGTHTIDGVIETDPNDETETKKVFKMEWTNEGNALHSEAPTPAQLVTDENGNDSVDWDLSSHGVLLNGVTYTVTFDVWPTQYTYDLIADLNNDTVHYEDLREGSGSDYAGLDKYITKSLEGDYFLETNTEAVLSYKDTRKENPELETSKYVNPPKVATNVDMVDVVKKWENDFDGATGNPIDIVVNRMSGTTSDEFYRANLSFTNNYTVEDIDIATGLMRLTKNADGKTGSIQILESGHDYTFDEENGQHYRWEFVAQTIHPMLINGELHELILLDDAATQSYQNGELPSYSMPTDMPADADYYDDGEHKFIRINGKLYVLTKNNPTIKAFNYRRSNLNVSKSVDGENADPDELFEFTITVNDPGLWADENLWFSIYDENDKVIIDENLPISDEWTAEIEDGNPSGFYYAPNGTTLVVSLKVGQNLRFTNLTTKATYTILESDKNNYAFTGAEGSADYGSAHTPFDYTEGTDYEVDKNTKTITGGITLTNSTFSIEVENTYELASIDLTKVWDDSSDQDGKRPDDIKVQIKRQVGKNGTPENYGDPITITNENVSEDDSNRWVYTIESTEELSLPRFDADGNEYLYTVEELAVNDYVTTCSPTTVNQTDGQATYTITNKHTPELYHTDGVLEVTKHWDDFDNEDGLRIPVTIVLYKNGEPTSKTMTLTTDQDSSSKFTDLPMYEDGVEISYTIVETTTLEGYEDPDYDMETAGSFKVTNKHIPLYHEDGVLEITKVWDDVQNVDELREDVTIELYVNGAASGKTITLTTADGASDKFTDLPKYDENGDVINYTIVETTSLTGYEDPSYDTRTAGSFTVTNKHVPLYNTDGELEVTKHWDDFDNEDKLRQEVTIELYINGKASGKTITLSTDQDSNDKFTNLPKYDENGDVINYTIVETTSLTGYEDPSYDTRTAGSFTVTNKHVPLYNTDGELEVTKHWDDFDNEDNLRQEVTIELYINGKASGKTITLSTDQDSNDKFTNLPRYDENGDVINYTIVETTSLTGYEDPSYDTRTAGSFTVTNKHVPLYNKDGKLKVTKYWEDNDNYDGLRKNVTIELYINGKASGKTVTLTTDDGSNDLFTDLPKYDENGDVINYTIVETTSLTGYEDPSYDTRTAGSFTVTNVHGVVPVNIDVTKIWIDNANQDGKRKDEITVKIFANGKFLRNETIKGDVTKDTWTYTIRGLDKYENGIEIAYTLEEVQVEEYEKPSVSGNAEDGFVIKNTHNPRKISKTGTKTWDHTGNLFDYPESITVILHAKVGEEEIGDPVRQVVTEKDGKWEYSFTGLDEYKDGKLITYWVDEAPVTDYATVIDENGNIKNTYNPEKFTINGTKTWDDENNQDGKRPDHITVILHGKVDGTEIREVRQEKDVYEKDGKWEYKFENVLKYAGGEEIVYSIEELPVDEYDAPIIHGTADEGFSITNHHTPETISYIITKNWNDYNNADDIRPDSITVTLYKTIDNVRSVERVFTISAENNWTCSFDDLPRYAGGVEIEYDIVEDVVNGYSTVYATDETEVDGLKEISTVITNSQVINLDVEKIWDDKDNKDNLRPEYISFKLFANGTYLNTYVIEKTDGWKLTIENLLKYLDNVEIIYTIEEEAVQGYVSKIDGFKITNYHEVKDDNIEELPPRTGVNNKYDYFAFIPLIGISVVLPIKAKKRIYRKRAKLAN